MPRRGRSSRWPISTAPGATQGGRSEQRRSRAGCAAGGWTGQRVSGREPGRRAPDAPAVTRVGQWPRAPPLEPDPCRSAAWARGTAQVSKSAVPPSVVRLAGRHSEVRMAGRRQWVPRSPRLVLLAPTAVARVPGARTSEDPTRRGRRSCRGLLGAQQRLIGGCGWGGRLDPGLSRRSGGRLSGFGSGTLTFHHGNRYV